MRSTVVVTTLALALLAGQAHAQWGNFTAQFVVNGDVPKPSKLDVAKEAFCLKHAAELVDESLLVDPETKGLKNVIVSLLPGDKKVPVHPDYAAAAGGEVEADNSKCRFEPRVVTMRTTQTLVIKNSDPMGHNAKLDLFENNSENPLVPPGQSVKLNFKKPETRPMPMSCSIHPWMGGNIVIREDPYVGVSDKDGKVTIKNLPAGDWTLVFWHERPAYITSGTVGKTLEKWAKGRVKITIKDKQDLDFGKVELTADQLKKKG